MLTMNITHHCSLFPSFFDQRLQPTHQSFFFCLFSFYAVRELLSFYEFPGDDIPVIKGSALAAATGGDTKLGRDSILELMNAVEAYIPTPARETEKPFLMPVEDTFSISGRGTVVTGRVEQGKIKTGEDIEVVGLVATQKTICTGKYNIELKFEACNSYATCAFCCVLCGTVDLIVMINKLYLDLSRLLAVHVERTIELFVDNEQYLV